MKNLGTEQDYYTSAAPRDFGMTCPILSIARYYRVSYEDCLYYADARIHKRMPQAVYAIRLPSPAMVALEMHADKYNRLRHGLES